MVLPSMAFMESYVKHINDKSTTKSSNMTSQFQHAGTDMDEYCASPEPGELVIDIGASEERQGEGGGTEGRQGEGGGTDERQVGGGGSEQTVPGGDGDLEALLEEEEGEEEEEAMEAMDLSVNHKEKDRTNFKDKSMRVNNSGDLTDTKSTVKVLQSSRSSVTFVNRNHKVNPSERPNLVSGDMQLESDLRVPKTYRSNVHNVSNVVRVKKTWSPSKSLETHSLVAGNSFPKRVTFQLESTKHVIPNLPLLDGEFFPHLGEYTRKGP